MEDLIVYAIFFVFFFLGPLLKRIFEAASSGGSKRLNEQDVQEYLNRMRGNQPEKRQPQVHPKYQVNSTKLKPQTQEQFVEEESGSGVKNRVQPNRLQNSLDEKRLQRQATGNKSQNRVEKRAQDVANKVEKDIDSQVFGKVAEIHVRAARSTSSSNLIQQRVLQNKKFDEMQKAVILAEIFSKPKGALTLAPSN